MLRVVLPISILFVGVLLSGPSEVSRDSLTRIVVGAVPECCINASRPQCSTQTAFTTCRETAIGTVPTACNVPTTPLITKGWSFYPCNDAQCLTSQTATDKCVRKKLKKNMTGCKNKGTVTKANDCGTPAAGKEFVRCDYSEYDHNAAGGGPVALKNRESQVQLCGGTGDVTCAAGQPQYPCN